MHLQPAWWRRWQVRWKWPQCMACCTAASSSMPCCKRNLSLLLDQHINSKHLSVSFAQQLEFFLTQLPLLLTHSSKSIVPAFWLGVSKGLHVCLHLADLCSPYLQLWSSGEGSRAAVIDISDWADTAASDKLCLWPPTHDTGWCSLLHSRPSCNSKDLPLLQRPRTSSMLSGVFPGGTCRRAWSVFQSEAGSACRRQPAE